MSSATFVPSPQRGTSGRLHNFSAGPGALPAEVIEEIREELPVYGGAGASIMEISHRSKEYDAVYDAARDRMRNLLGLGDDWIVLFLQGGASMQFHQVPLNFLHENGSADYIVTGEWAQKAHKEATYIADKRNARANVAATSVDANFNYVPVIKNWQFDPSAAYLHFTSNNTIFGTQVHTDPDVGNTLVCDMSSDFLSRPVDTSNYGLIYAGAQKNIGPAGATAVLIRKDFYETRLRGLPTILAYETHATKLFNTPPVFAVYIVEKVLRWLEENGGLEAMAAYNDQKAATLYGAIDGSDFYQGTAEVGSRSKMNVTFRLTNTDLEPTFIQEAKAAGLLALKGHRSVGGLRASIYNACRQESVDALVAFMREFERTHG